MNKDKVQDSCTGPRFPRIPRFLGTIKQDPDKVPKNLGILGNLGPVHESCTLFIGILGNLGPVQVLWKSYVKLCCLFEKMHFPCVFWWWTSELVQRVFIFWWNFWQWRTGFWFCIIGCFFKTDDCNRNYFTYSVFKKHWYLQWFLHVPQVERWRWRYICDTPPPAGRPRGGDHINISCDHAIYIHKIVHVLLLHKDTLCRICWTHLGEFKIFSVQILDMD